MQNAKQKDNGDERAAKSESRWGSCAGASVRLIQCPAAALTQP